MSFVDLCTHLKGVETILNFLHLKAVSFCGLNSWVSSFCGLFYLHASLGPVKAALIIAQLLLVLNKNMKSTFFGVVLP